MALLAIAVVALLIVGYVVYGRFIARTYALDDARVTPAVRLDDGVDFVPTPRFYLLGQHFSAIAAAGPIAGPILACQLFGWLPCVLWIVVGVVFIGAVHDFSALIASVRHGASSVAEVVREHVGRRAWLAMMLFIWLALVYVLVAFADITATTFVGKTEELAGLGGRFNKGGAVAAASALYLLLALTMGLVQKRFAPPLWLLTLIFVPATLGAVWAGTHLSTWLVWGARTWGLVILAYCFVAAMLPMWLLLQPRGYLGGFVLYLALAVGVGGIFFSGLEIQQPAFKTWEAPSAMGMGTLFPFLFVTIACGACSGFHGLVCSGTTSKQIRRESDCRPVGYGGMLLEGFVALIALATIMFVADSDVAGRGPGRIYGDGIGRFVAAIVGEEHLLFASTFGAMAFSTFVFDTIDVGTRLGRYIVQELLAWKGRAAMVLATALTVLPPAIVLGTTQAVPGQPPSYMRFWALFGTANQLLAALTLMGVAVWLRREGRRTWFVVAPMIFVLSMTVWSLLRQIALSTDALIRGTAIALLALAALLAAESLGAVLRGRAAMPAAEGEAR
ncbi:MAG: carbon starvation CstA family protein [Myxococcota bacterium]